MRRAIPLLVVFALTGCPTTETHDTSPHQTKVAPVQDTPPPAWATEEAPDFAEPKPPVPATSRGSKEPESTREQLLHSDNR